MDFELIALIRNYLDNVTLVLSIFKSKVGEPVEEGDSWEANIPDDGNYPDCDISKFYRHGIGISVYYKNMYLDFDFRDLNLPDLDGSDKFITIDVGFLAAFIESLGIQNERWTDYSLLNEDLNKLVDQGTVRKIEYKYYLEEDLDGLEKSLSN